MFFWYAVYTSSRAEKKVKERLNEAGIENYLPLRTEYRLWSDRKKKVSVPLIPGYIFVRVEEVQFLTVLNTPGVISFLKEKAKAVTIPDKQINQLKFIENNTGSPVEISFGEIPPGAFVKIVRGTLSGFEGEVTEVCDKYKIVLRLDHLGCALITVPVSCIEVAGEGSKCLANKLR